MAIGRRGGRCSRRLGRLGSGTFDGRLCSRRVSRLCTSRGTRCGSLLAPFQGFERLGAKLGGIIFSKHGKYYDLPSKGGWENSVGALTRTAEKARAAGVTLNLEIVNRFEVSDIKIEEPEIEAVVKRIYQEGIS